MLGHIVIQLKKLETNLIVVHAGLLVLLKHSVIDGVLLITNKVKTEFQVKISYHVVDCLLVHAMVVILHKLGDI